METEKQASKWIVLGEPKPKRPRQRKSRIKTLLSVFFYYTHSVIHNEFLPTGTTVTKNQQ